MKHRILVISSIAIVLLAAAMIVLFKATDKDIPFLPVDINSVDTISLSANHIATDAQTKQIITCINGIKSYESRGTLIDHSKPGPITAIQIYLKDKKYIIIYQDYDGKAKISNSHTAYVLNNSVISGLLNQYNAYDE